MQEHDLIEESETRPSQTRAAAAGQRETAAPPVPEKPRRGRLALIAITILLFLAALFVMGYLPRRAREKELAAAVAHEKVELPKVNVTEAKQTPPNSNLQLPGNITPLTEAVINARAEGYLKKRYVDIGDRVKAGQVLAELEAPELDQQVQQARATLAQTQAALARAQHVLTQAQANARLSDVTAKRWKTLADRGVVSKQELDQRQAQSDADDAAVHSAESDVKAAEENIRATEANLRRLIQLQDYEKVTAPFAGIVTARNVDVGSLISTTGSTPMFKIAQIDVLRLVVDVPEQSVPFIKVGQPAELQLQEFGSRVFHGTVTRTANSLDATTRTLPTEVQVRNPDLSLLPNMFAQVKLIGARTTPALLIPGDALIARADGTFVAVVREGNRVHFQPVKVGRDYGAQLEITSGLSAGDRVIGNPTDDVREGAEVDPVMQKGTPARSAAGANQKPIKQ